METLNQLRGILFEESTIWHFVLVNLLIGASAAWMTGKSCARTWRPFAICVFYLFLLSLAVRFVHFALFETTLVSFHFWLVDLGIVLVVGWMGFRSMRAAQMQTKYAWMQR